MCMYLHLLPHNHNAVRSFCLRSIENSKVCFSRQYRQVIHGSLGSTFLRLKHNVESKKASFCWLILCQIRTEFDFENVLTASLRFAVDAADSFRKGRELDDISTTTRCGISRTTSSD